MKKLLLIATASAAILSSAATFADCSMTTTESSMSSMDEGKFYVRADVGASIFDKQKDKETGVKMKSNTVFVGELAVGYYFLDNARVDLSIAMPANPQLKKSAVINKGSFIGETVSVKHKGTVSALLLNGFVDVFEVDMAKFFVGAGVGMSYIKEKITNTGPNIGNYAVSIKKKYDFAYQGSVGASAKVADGVNAELVYSYRGYGKTKTKTVDGSITEGGTKYQGNNVMAGVRFDI